MYAGDWSSDVCTTDLFPPIEQPTVETDGNRIKSKAKTPARKAAMSARALSDLADWQAS